LVEAAPGGAEYSNVRKTELNLSGITILWGLKSRIWRLKLLENSSGGRRPVAKPQK
jgi:hypothetical protein